VHLEKCCTQEFMIYYYKDEATGQFLNKSLNNFASTIKDVGTATSKTQAKKAIKEQGVFESVRIVSEEELEQEGYSGISEAFSHFNNTRGFTSAVFSVSDIADVNAITDVLEVCTQVSSARNESQSLLDLANLQQQDLLHILEFYDLSDEDYVAIAKRLHEVRQIRRKSQVQVDIARELDALFQKRTSKSECVEALRSINSRVYTPRVYFDLFKEMNAKYGLHDEAGDTSSSGTEEK